MANLATFYNEKYYIDFSSAPDDSGAVVDYRISLLLREGRQDLFPNPTELQGGPSPFVLSLGNDNDPLVATRTSSAQISFFDDIVLSELLSSDATEWQVRLTRNGDGKLMFLGYLTAEVYTQPAIEGPNIVTINAASPLVPILAEAMPLQGVGKMTIGELLHMAVSVVKGISAVYMPAMYSLSFPLVQSQLTDILRLSLATAMYAKQNNLAALTGSDFEYSSFAEPIEALCKLFGWSLVDVGDGALYFVSPGYEGDYMKLSADDLIKTSVFTPSMVQPSIFDEGALLPIDAGDTMEIRQGAGSVTIKVESTGINVEAPNVEECVQEQIFVRLATDIAYTTEEGVGRSEATVAKIETKVEGSHVEVYKYALSAELKSENLVEKTWNRTPDYMTEGCAGCEFQKIEWVDSEELKITAEKRKRSWMLQPVYFIKEKASVSVPGYTPYGKVSAYIPDNLPVLRLNAGQGSFSGGALCVNANIMAVYKEGFWLASDDKVQGGGLKEPVNIETNDFWSVNNKVIRCSLRVGDRWWSGTRWVAEQSTFYLSVSTAEAQWHPLVSNKNVDMLYEDSDGVYFPILDPIAGEIELTLYRTEVLSSSGVQSGYNGSYYIKDLSVSYKPSIEHAIPSVASTTFYRGFNSLFNESKQVSLNLHSRINVSEQLSLLYKDASTSLDAIYRTTHVEAAKPEQFLLDEYQRIYGRALQRWRRGVMMRDVRPIDIFSRPGLADHRLVMTGYTADFDENTISLYLSDVIKVELIHYVN